MPPSGHEVAAIYNMQRHDGHYACKECGPVIDMADLSDSGIATKVAGLLFMVAPAS